MIRIEHLKKEYPNVTPLRDVNVEIHDGDVIAVIGPSGCGKSTLLRCINLLEQPTAGSIRIDGTEITDPSCDIHKIRRKLGMVFQSFNLFQHLTAIENIMMPQVDLLGLSRQEAYDRGVGLLKKVGLLRQALKYPDQMSGGQKQRVAIARTLAMDPAIIMFDEPTSALDPGMIGEVEAVIRTLADEGKTMLIVTHDLRFARAVSRRVFYLDEGGIYEDAPTEEIFTAPKRERTRQFIRNLKVLEIEIKGENYDFPGAYSLITEYSRKNLLSSNMAMHLQLVFEELVQQILRPQCGDAPILFTAEYSEQEERTRVVVRYGGKPADLTLPECDLPLTLLEGVSYGMQCEEVPEGNVISLWI